MKRIPFPLNDKDFIIEFHKTREGPSGFMCYYKNAATYRIDPLDAWRTLGVAKFTDTGKTLKAWCLEVSEQHNMAKPEPEQVQPDNQFFDHFGDDSHRHEEPSDDWSSPNDNTKMVT